MTNQTNRGPFLSTMSVLLFALAISNCTKAIQYSFDPSHLGIVVFGVRFESVAANLILGPLMGFFVGAYAYSLWKLRPWAVPLSIVYAFYVPTNLVLFWFLQTGTNEHPVAGILVYLLFAFSGSIGTALYLGYHRDKLAGAMPRPN